MAIIYLKKVNKAIQAYKALNPDEQKEFRALMGLLTDAEADGE